MHRDSQIWKFVLSFSSLESIIPYFQLCDFLFMSQKITREELAKHNKPDDCWCAYEGEVYDMTTYIKKHPGGQKPILACAGGDMTEVYKKHHAYLSINIIAQLKVGVLDE